MNSVVTQRFIKCLEQLKEENKVRSNRQFALSLDYLPQSLSEILKGRRDATIELIRKSVETYHFNPIYLYTGDGPFFLSDEAVQDNYRMLTVVASHSSDEQIIHVPIPAQSGYVNNSNNPEFIKNLPAFTLPEYKYKEGTHRSFDISGDSMEPTLFEGDKVVCSYIPPNNWESVLKDNYVYVIVTKGDLLVKRILNHVTEDNTLEIFSDNDFYNPYRIDINDIQEIWYVRAKISPFLPSPKNIKTYLADEIGGLKHTITEQSKLIQLLNTTIEKLLDQSGEIAP